MSVGIGVDVGAAVVKVATAGEAIARRSHVGVRELDFPDLVSRVGTGIPFVGLGGETTVTRHAHDMFADEVRGAVARLTEPGPDGGSSITVIAPDWWTRRAHEAVRVALVESGMAKAQLTSAAVAAVRGYQAVAPSMPDTVAVLDLGAYTCSAAVVTGCQSDDVRRVGHPTVVHGRGGNDLDARLLHHVLDGLRGQGLSYERTDPEAVKAARELLVEARIAKEALSATSVTTMAPHMPGASSQVRLVRAEHDDIARPAVQEIVHMLRDCIAAGGHDVQAVLLVGGGAPIPIVTQQISVELGLPVLLDDDPATLAARGAALVPPVAAPTKGDAQRKSLRRQAKRDRPRTERTSTGGGRRRAAPYGASALDDGPAPQAARGAVLVSSALDDRPAPQTARGAVLVSSALDDGPAPEAARGAVLASSTSAPIQDAPPPVSARPPVAWPGPRAERTSAGDARRRIGRTGIAAVYVAFALVATGGPSPSAGSSDATSNPPVNASLVSNDPDERPRPPSPGPEPELEPADQIVPASAVGVAPAASANTPKAKKTTSASGSTTGGGNQGDPAPDPPPADPPADPPPSDPPPSDPPPPPADEGTGGDVP